MICRSVSTKYDTELKINIQYINLGLMNSTNIKYQPSSNILILFYFRKHCILNKISILFKLKKL